MSSSNTLSMLLWYSQITTRQGTKKMYYKGILYGVFFVLAGCTPKTNKKQSADNPEKPTWLNAKPISEAYYIGIGHSIKIDNYIQDAQKNALEDIASSIKVNVSSTTTLSKIAIDKAFYEKYEQITKTSVSDELEGYEQMDNWQDDTHYWVYCRLSKTAYHERKKAQKKNATDKALDLLAKARQYKQKDNDVQAIAFYFKSLTSVRDYLTYPLRLPYQGKTILLTNEIYTSIQNMLNNIRLSASPTEIEFNRKIGQNPQVITVQALHKYTNRPIIALPLKAQFETGGGAILSHHKTDENGKIRILISKITTKDAQHTISVKVDLIDFGAHPPKAIDTLIANKIITPQVGILLNVLPPKIYITVSQKTLGKEIKNGILAKNIENYLTKTGFMVTRNEKQSELRLDVKAYSEKGSVSGSLYAAYATATILVTDLKKKNEVYKITLNRIKDYGLDYDKASRAAYNKLIEKLEKTTLPELIDAVL